jgi:hypothetical protein
MPEEIEDKCGLTEEDIASFVEGKRILLVGNSSAARKTNHSDFIDGFDVVVRFNRGIPNKNMGTKTDIWACHYHTVSWQMSDYKALKCPKYILRVNKSNGYKWDNRLTPVTYWCPDGTIRNELKQKIYGKKAHKQPSAGASVVNFFLNHMNVSHIDLIGFDFFASGTFYGFTGTGGRPAHCRMHIPTNEEKFIRSFVKAGKLTLH